MPQPLYRRTPDGHPRQTSSHRTSPRRLREATRSRAKAGWGPELEGIRYEQLIPWVKPTGDAFRVIVGDYVTTSGRYGHRAHRTDVRRRRRPCTKAAGIAPLFMVDKAGKKPADGRQAGQVLRTRRLDPEFVKNNIDVEKYKASMRAATSRTPTTRRSPAMSRQRSTSTWPC